METTRCKRCLLREAFPADYQKYVLSLLQKIRPADRAEQTCYDRRLAICGQCDQLNHGTCMGCGCLVELRAAYRKEKCPFRRWENG
ncbi:MAG: hypothetical protein IJ662_09575 [Clostridia bacterium]|nr:hypothetical protein [Clostridia bacterium]